MIESLFPKKEFRPGQKEVIEKILSTFESGKKHVFYDGPCGAGKSVVAYTVAKHFGSAYYLTSTKQLQSQLVGDFPDVVDLRGRNAYECTYWRRRYESLQKGDDVKKTMEARERAYEYRSCAVGECKASGLAKFEDCLVNGDCPYWKRVGEAQVAPICTMNYKCFLFQMRTQRFGKRDFLILDEGHSAESELMDFVGLSMNDKLLGGYNFGELGSVADYQRQFLEDDLGEILKAGSDEALFSRDFRRYEELERMKMKYDNFMKEDPEEWVFKLNVNKDGRSHSLEFKPIYVRKFAGEYMLNFADRVLIMSATLISAKLIADALAIPEGNYLYLRSQNRFPKENRPIYKSYAGSMIFRDKAATMPKLIGKVDEICRHYQEHRGIIHTHNFEIAKALISNCTRDVASRFLFQLDFKTKEAMLERHAEMPSSVIVAPAMHEGLDLTDDLSRFQIVCKIPYPNYKDDPQLAKRMEASRNYLGYLTALKLVQSVGRSVRSETDWADTYILDAEFERFIDRNRSILPSWFLEAIDVR
ncbi:MAG: helicase C-terminal domain-containing protein [Candidatus Nanopelagicaceae bacterium]|nr:helicase C-terminal domain-containing protein [Candidatus Nanopelagicaceae bacterium]